MRRSVVWVKPEGAEIAEVSFGDGRLAASGTAIGGDPLPYRLEYELETVDRYVTSRLLVKAYGQGWRRRLELRNTGGAWSIDAEEEGLAPLSSPGGDARALYGATDCDLGLSPLTNTMPALRLDGRRSIDVLAAWVSVPDLGVTPSPQMYEFVREDGAVTVIRYTDPGFTEEIAFRDGLVLDYPSIGRMVVSAA
jgi:hypothetical protein